MSLPLRPRVSRVRSVQVARYLYLLCLEEMSASVSILSPPTQPPHSPTPLQQKEWPEPELIPLCFATTQHFFQVLDSAPLCCHPNVISTCYSYETECIVIILIVRNPKKTHVSHHSVWSSLVRPALIAPHSPPLPLPSSRGEKARCFLCPRGLRPALV